MHCPILFIDHLVTEKLDVVFFNGGSFHATWKRRRNGLEKYKIVQPHNTPPKRFKPAEVFNWDLKRLPRKKSDLARNSDCLTSKVNLFIIASYETIIICSNRVSLGMYSLLSFKDLLSEQRPRLRIHYGRYDCLPRLPMNSRERERAFLY